MLVPAVVSHCWLQQSAPMRQYAPDAPQLPPPPPVPPPSLPAHALARHLRRQQSASAPHAAPGAAHCAMGGGPEAARHVASTQLPLQHDVSNEHAAPIPWHEGWMLHAPSTQFFPQHCSLSVHLKPPSMQRPASFWQYAVSPWRTQCAVQHSASTVHG